MARPTLFTDALASEILNRIADGQSLRAVCRDEAMPNRETVRVWLRDNADFRALHAQARQEQMDALGEEIFEIADDGSNDWMRSNREDDEGYRVNGEHIQRSRLRVEARKWMMSKLAPRRYGDKIALGGDADAPPVQVSLGDTELARKLCFLLTKADIEAAQGK